MGFIDWDISLQDSKRDIEGKIQKALNKELKKMFDRRASSITVLIREVIKNGIKETETYKLSESILMWEFGIVDLRRRLDIIIDKYVENIKLVQLTTRNFSLKFESDAIIEELLSLPDATFTEGDTTLPWLSWLLESGSDPIVLGWDVRFGNFKKSRTGKAVMIRDDGGGWRVPELVAGTPNNNFLTRGYILSIDKIEALVIGLFNGP